MTTIDYKMSKRYFNAILATRKSAEEKKMNPYSYVMKYLNEIGGYKNKVAHITFYN